jgi:hypothetical protein
MIIDITSNPSTNERRFFGLKKNGNYYFKDQNDSDTPYYSLFINDQNREDNYDRFHGESIFIKLGSKDSEEKRRECLLGVPKSGDGYTELYFFNENRVLSKLTSFIFGNITSNFFSIYKLPEDPNSNFHYIFSYIEEHSNFVIQTMYFNESLPHYYNYSYKAKFECFSEKIVTCFYTDNFKYVCFYHKINNYLTIILFEKNFTIRNETSHIEDEVVKTEDDHNNNIFFKGIHLKEEIGAFIYFESSNTQKPTLILKQFDEDIKNYSSFGDVKVNNTNFNSNVKLNDIIKLNNYQICYASTTENKDEINIVIFNLYNNDSQINIDYYPIKIKQYNNISLFKDLKIALYKDFIALTFSHILYQNNVTNNKFYSSLVIFNYPNSTDNSLDLIEQLKLTNKNIENDFCFSLKGKMVIENNIFDYEYRGTQIIDFPDNIYLKKNGKNIIKKEILLDKECLTLSFPSNYSYLEAVNYTIEYAYVLAEPIKNFIRKTSMDLNTHASNRPESLINSMDRITRLSKNYIGKSSNFTIIIKYNLTTNCQNYSCDLCTDEENYMCVTCKYNFTFNADRKKICLPNHTKSEYEVKYLNA